MININFCLFFKTKTVCQDSFSKSNKIRKKKKEEEFLYVERKERKEEEEEKSVNQRRRVYNQNISRRESESCVLCFCVPHTHLLFCEPIETVNLCISFVYHIIYYFFYYVLCFWGELLISFHASISIVFVFGGRERESKRGVGKAD